MASIPPPTWVSLSSEAAVNDYIRKNVIIPAYEQINPLMETLSQIYTLVQAALDFASSFLIDFLNPIKIIVDEIIKVIEGVIRDLKNAGFYATWDSAYSKSADASGFLPSLAPFRGGYSRVREELTRKLSDKKDTSRPDFSPSSSVLSITAVVDIEGETAYRQATALINTFLNLFSINKPIGAFPPPPAPKVHLALQRGSSNPVILRPERVTTENPPTGLIVVWSLPIAKSIPALQGLDLPPASFLIRITTRQTPYYLALEKVSPLSTGTTGRSDTIITPITSAKTGLPVTSDDLYLISNLSDFALGLDQVPTPNKPKLVAIPRIGALVEEMVSVEDLIQETKVVYYDTSVLGVLATGSEYRLYIPKANLPTKRYSAESKSVQDNITEYFISISSHNTSLDDVDDGAVITPHLTNPSDIYLKIDKDAATLAPTDSAAHAYQPTRSIPAVPISFPTNAGAFGAIAEAFTIFLMIERSVHPFFSSGYGLTEEGLNLIYSYLPNRPCYESFFYSTDDEVAYRSDIKDYVDQALAKFMARGAEITPDIKARADKLERLLAGKNIYSTLSQPRAVEGNTRLGWIPSSEILIGPTAKVPDPVTFDAAYLGFDLSRFSYLRVFMRKDRALKSPAFITGVGEGENFFDRYTDEQIRAALELLVGLPTRRSHFGVGAWVYAKLFTDGFVFIDQFLDLAKNTLQDFSDGLKGIIDGVKQYIEMLKQRIDTLYQFILKIKAIIDGILSIRLPSGAVAYMMTVSDGTQGVINALYSSENQPRSGDTVLSTYAMLVLGGLPKIVTEFLLSLVDNQSTVDNLFNPEG